MLSLLLPCSADAAVASAVTSTSSTFASASESDEEDGSLTLSTKNLPQLWPVLRFDKLHKKIDEQSTLRVQPYREVELLADR